MQMTAHDAFSALINLSDTAPVVEQLNDPDFLSVIFFTIIVSDSQILFGKKIIRGSFVRSLSIRIMIPS
jgi:hypothetical protein